ncbi:MAG: hypothetical protein IT479_06985 [Xanthomonadales bacterium]|nr:hypothetical protein [Anaerolineae bacterium]MCC6593006.1 hypothetical protein [Xanthomonadales bacterium]
MNQNVPFPRAGGTWHHNAKTGKLAPESAAQPASAPTPATPAAPAPKAERKPTRRNRAAD